VAVTFHVKDLVKRYPNFTLEVGELEVGPGVNVLLGPNGSGKSVLMRLLLGMTPPTRGRVWIEVEGVGWTARHALRYVGYVPSRVDLPAIKVRDLLELYGVDLGDDPFEVEQLAGEKYSNLSSGQKKRVQLAVALGADKEAYFLDEPFTNIDAEYVARLEDVIERLGGKGKTILVSTHILSRLLRNKLIVLDSGSLVCSCHIPNILEEVIVVSRGDGEHARLAEIEGVRVEFIENPVAFIKNKARGSQ